MKLVSERLDYQSINQEWRTLRRCSVLNSYKLLDRYNQLMDYLKSLDGNLSVEETYLKDDYFRYLANECLTLGGIDPVDCSIDMLITFLFPHYDSDNNLVDTGLLISFNFPNSKKAKKASMSSTKDDLSNLVASLWVMTEDLGKGLEILDTLCSEDLMSVLNERSEILKPPEEKKKEQDKKKVKELMKSRGLLASKDG